MSKYIDEDKVLKIVNDMTECEDDYERITEWIHNMPSIDIVRCKECKYYDKFRTWSACTYWSGDPYEQADVNDDDFCSYGERKESE